MAIGPEYIAAGGSLVGGLLSGAGASSSGKKIREAMMHQTNVQRDMWEQQRQDFAPWLQAGMVGLEELQGMLSPDYDVTQSPGYQFRYQQGLDSLQSILSKSGLRGSGAAIKAGVEYGQGMGAGEYDTQWNRLAQLAGMGSGPVQMQGQIGAQYANQMGNALMQGHTGMGAAKQQQMMGYGQTATNIGDIFARQMNLNNLMGQQTTQFQNPMQADWSAAVNQAGFTPYMAVGPNPYD